MKSVAALLESHGHPMADALNGKYILHTRQLDIHLIMDVFYLTAALKA